MNVGGVANDTEGHTASNMLATAPDLHEIRAQERN
jgi:hypothetical protein